MSVSVIIPEPRPHHGSLEEGFLQESALEVKKFGLSIIQGFFAASSNIDVLA